MAEMWTMCSPVKSLRTAGFNNSGAAKASNQAQVSSKKVTDIVKSALVSAFPVIGIPGRCRRIVVWAVGDTALAAANPTRQTGWRLSGGGRLHHRNLLSMAGQFDDDTAFFQGANFLSAMRLELGDAQLLDIHWDKLK